jgi:hypothetical protein
VVSAIDAKVTDSNKIPQLACWNEDLKCLTEKPISTLATLQKVN